MSRRRRIAVVSSMLLVLAGAALYLPGPASAGHGFSYADCPLSITLNKSSSLIVFGQSVNLFGTLNPEPGADVVSEAIVLKRRVSGTSAILGTTTALTNSAGAFSAWPAPDKSAVHFATFGPTVPCPLVTSGTVGVGVRVRVTIATSHTKPAAGQSFIIRGLVSPNHAGQVVKIRARRVGMTAFSDNTVVINPSSGYHKVFVSNLVGTTYEFKTIYGKQHPDHESNVSASIFVTIV